MNKSLLTMVCLVLNVCTVYCQEIHVEIEDKDEIKKVVDVVSKKIFKDSKIQLMDLDEVISEVEKEKERNLSIIQDTIQNDSTVKTIQTHKSKLVDKNGFEEPFKEANNHPGLKASEIESSKNGLPSKEIPNLPSEKLSSLIPQGILPELEPSSLKELPPIPGNKIKTKYLSLLDSIREINLSDSKMKLTEKVEGKSKEVLIKEKQSIKDKTYFEGVVGVLGDNIKMVNISPALGYQMLKKYSMGLGPEIRVNHGKSNPLSLIGMRSFAKYEILKKKIYLQMEDVSTPFKNNDVVGEVNRERKKINHSLSLGGGYLLHLTKSSSLNFSFMYRVNQNNLLHEGVSPLTFRLGVSSFAGSGKK